MRRSAAVIAVAGALALTLPGGLIDPPPAQAGLASTACNLLGTIGEGWWGKACGAVVDVGGKLVGAGKKAGSVVSKLAGNGLLQRGLGIAAIVAWVLGGAKWTVDHLGAVISASTSPTLTTHWFTGVYLRIEGLAVFFTLLFILAAAAEAILRSDLSVIARAVFAYLPLAALLTAVAAPLTMLLLAATDRMSSGVAAIAGSGSTHFLTGAGAWVVGGLTVADPFFAVLAAGLVVAAGAALWVELLIREVAVYVVVALLPIAFASLVWPARRVWAVRSIELLVALILSKVAIVAVLALGGAALSHAGLGSLSRLLGGLALIILGAFTPWMLLRLIPLAEVGAAAVGHVRGHVHSAAGVRTPEAAVAGRAAERVGGVLPGGGSSGSRHGFGGGMAVGELLDQMQRRARGTEPGSGASGGGGAAPRPAGSPGSAAASSDSGGQVVEADFPAPSQLRLPGVGSAAGIDGTSGARSEGGGFGGGSSAAALGPLPPRPWEGTDGSGGSDEGPPRPSPPPDPRDPPLNGEQGTGL